MFLSSASTQANLTVFYDEETKNGDVYWHMKPFNLLLLNTKLFTVNFENLFNGDKVLGKRNKLHLRSAEELNVANMVTFHLITPCAPHLTYTVILPLSQHVSMRFLHFHGVILAICN